MIIAVDFDGILCEDEFPEIGAPYYDMVSFVRQLIDEGHEVVLWTSRTGDRLAEAAMWCEDRGLHFCAINENAPSNLAQYLAEYPTPSPKVYADLYLEDRDPWFVRHAQTYRGKEGHESALYKLIDYTRKSINKLEDERRRREERERIRQQAVENMDMVKPTIASIAEGATDD